MVAHNTHPDPTLPWTVTIYPRGGDISPRALPLKIEGVMAYNYDAEAGLAEFEVYQGDGPGRVEVVPFAAIGRVTIEHSKRPVCKKRFPIPFPAPSDDAFLCYPDGQQVMLIDRMPEFEGNTYPATSQALRNSGGFDLGLECQKPKHHAGACEDGFKWEEPDPVG